MFGIDKLETIIILHVLITICVSQISGDSIGL